MNLTLNIILLKIKQSVFTLNQLNLVVVIFITYCFNISIFHSFVSELTTLPLLLVMFSTIFVFECT